MQRKHHPDVELWFVVDFYAVQLHVDITNSDGYLQNTSINHKIEVEEKIKPNGLFCAFGVHYY